MPAAQAGDGGMMLDDRLDVCGTCGKRRRLWPTGAMIRGRWVVSCRCSAMSFSGGGGGPGTTTPPYGALRPQALGATLTWRQHVLLTLLIEEPSTVWLPQQAMASRSMRPGRP